MKIEITSMRQQYRMAISEYICTYILTYIIPSTYFYLLLQTRDRTQLSRQAGDKKTDPLSKKKTEYLPTYLHKQAKEVVSMTQLSEGTEQT